MDCLGNWFALSLTKGVMIRFRHCTQAASNDYCGKMPKDAGMIDTVIGSQAQNYAPDLIREPRTFSSDTILSHACNVLPPLPRNNSNWSIWTLGGKMVRISCLGNATIRKAFLMQQVPMCGKGL